jgi:hypothetical protein
MFKGDDFARTVNRTGDPNGRRSQTARAGLHNFKAVYRDRVDYWQWFDNSGTEPVLLAAGRRP